MIVMILITVHLYLSNKSSRTNSRGLHIEPEYIWLDDETIPSLVTTKLPHPEDVVVSTNMINFPLMSWVHYHMNALHPYLPEVRDLPSTFVVEAGVPNTSRRSWHYRDYPYWSGPTDEVFHHDFDPSYEGHRWLRLPDDSEIERTPLARLQYNTWGTGLANWEVTTPVLYSFLENLAEQRLDRYQTSKRWLTSPDRLSINFIAVWSSDVLDHLPMDSDDEIWLTVTLPRKLRCSVTVDMHALAVHFSFRYQAGLEQTDLLPRFSDYAVAKIC
ncbi:hypothetical protein H2200_013637 [Cladophialophora chaetospira]|uniref:Uncharacterized protein n=1 Tax=Cladophialophora chaetospira TaxID=386627 RepID=A0AA38TX92_9EURO|nr:hypothetical protein H2200_013637 [Cladophialophora chaetospira]